MSALRLAFNYWYPDYYDHPMAEVFRRKIGNYIIVYAVRLKTMYMEIRVAQK